MKFHLKAFLLVTALITCALPEAQCRELKKSSLIEGVEKFKQLVKNSEKSFGLESGGVFTEEYDAGFGIGFQFNQTFLHPYIDRPFLQSSQSVQFWGASNDLEDASIAGFIETLTHRAPVHPNMTLFAGMSAGYFWINKKIADPETGDSHEKNTNSFELFITLGTEFKISEISTMFLQFKYGETTLSRQIHTTLGMNFSSFKRILPER